MPFCQMITMTIALFARSGATETMWPPQNTRKKGSSRGVGGGGGGKLLTKEGQICKVSSQSFQSERIRNASASGKDAYAIYHAKHRTQGVGGGAQNQVTMSNPGSGKEKGRGGGDIYLSEVNFVPRYALLLFSGGTIELRDNTAIVLDGWLKFKVGSSKSSNSSSSSHPSSTGIVLIRELRKELDKMLLKRLQYCSNNGPSLDEDGRIVTDKMLQKVVHVVTHLLMEE